MRTGINSQPEGRLPAYRDTVSGSGSLDISQCPYKSTRASDSPWWSVLTLPLLAFPGPHIFTLYNVAARGPGDRFSLLSVLKHSRWWVVVSSWQMVSAEREWRVVVVSNLFNSLRKSGVAELPEMASGVRFTLKWELAMGALVTLGWSWKGGVL